MPLINIDSLIEENPIIRQFRESLDDLERKAKKRFQLKKTPHGTYVILDTDHKVMNTPEKAVSIEYHNKLTAWCMESNLNKEWNDFLQYYSKGEKR